MIRRLEKEHTFHIKGQQKIINFFIYDSSTQKLMSELVTSVLGFNIFSDIPPLPSSIVRGIIKQAGGTLNDTK